MTAALAAQALELLLFVPLAPGSDEVGVRVIDRPWFASLSAGDAEALLGQVPTGKMTCEVGCGKD
ncbi:MAG: hypothetical protein MSC30_20560 [Gaiellaceae bacterium MAG52_C11]|nr:hypothetical protein [Candidatus Gaiellasilicea maunaloa]